MFAKVCEEIQPTTWGIAGLTGEEQDSWGIPEWSKRERRDLWRYTQRMLEDIETIRHRRLEEDEPHKDILRR